MNLELVKKVAQAVLAVVTIFQNEGNEEQ